MSNKRKVVIVLVGGVIALIVLSFVVLAIFKYPYTSKIPELPESQTLSDLARDLSHKPTCEQNLTLKLGDSSDVQ